MPLKPIFDKAPLTAMSRQPLRAGLVRSENETLKQLYALVAADESPAALEGAFRLACIVAKPEDEAVTARIRKALEQQQPDGSFDLPLTQSIAILRAAWALYEYEARKPILEHIAKWCAWAAQHWDDLMADDAIWADPADLLELMEHMYRVTGKVALLTLCERLTNQTMAWSNVLNTINVQRPTCRSMARDELLTGLAMEKGARDGFYTHFYRTNHPERLADGARSALAKGLYSGSATELNATRTGWERLERYHGAICGGLTADELLEGKAPSMAMSTASLGAWAEALCSAAMMERSGWAWDAVERMAFNAMPACLHEGKLLSCQRVNSLVADPAKADCYHLAEDAAHRALLRLTRAYASVYASVVTATPAGFDVNLYLSGKYAVPVKESLLILSVSYREKDVSITVHCKQDVKAAARLRMPAWSRNTEVTLNSSEIQADCDNGVLTIERTWHDGDVITIVLDKSLRVLDGHHQGKYLLKGPIVMALAAADDGWARSFVSVADEESALFDTVKDWRRKGDVPADVPVLPAASGNAPQRLVLTPYAKTPVRIALFPGRQNA